MLTIYTPTYNRSKYLYRLYDSLCNQTDLRFLWLVIDDGSTDDTKEMISKWMNENRIQIQYYYKRNGGVHTARDFAYATIENGLVWGVDSDDWLKKDAVSNVLNLWEKQGSERYLGIFAPVCDVDNRNHFMNYPPLEAVSFQDLFYKYKGKGDQTIIIRADVVRKLKPFPVYDGEKLVSESFKWIQLPDKPFLILKNFTTFIEYQDSGYSKNVRCGYFKNLNGYFDLYNIHVLCAKFFKERIEFCLKYFVAGFFLNHKRKILSSYRPWLAFFLYPAGLILYLILKVKWKKYR